MRRLHRKVSRAKLRLLDHTLESVDSDAEACLRALRAGLTASDSIAVDGVVVAEAPDYRERRLSAEAILHHHRDVVKLATEKEPPVHIDQSQHLHIGDGDRERIDAMLSAPPVVIDIEADVYADKPNGKAGSNGHAGG